MRNLCKVFFQNFLKARFALAILTCLFAAGMSPVALSEGDFLVFNIANAQEPIVDDNYGLDSDFQNIAIQSDRDIKQIIALIVNIFLGFLGIIAVILILYAGYMWMTAGGNADKVEQAKLILRNAVIGLVIVLSAWAIAAFIIRQLGAATGAGGDGNDRVPYDPDNNIGVEDFSIKAFKTTHETDPKKDVYRCSSIQTQFNHWVNEESFKDLYDKQRLKVVKKDKDMSEEDWRKIEDPDSVADLIVSKRNNIISFKKDKYKEGKDEGERILWEPTTDYEVLIDERLENTTKDKLKECEKCSVSATKKDNDKEYFKWRFKTGTETEDTKPEITYNYPEDGQTNVPRYLIFSLEFSEPIDETTVLDEEDNLITKNIKLQPVIGGAPIEAISGNAFDVSVHETRIVFGLNEKYIPDLTDRKPGLLNAYTEHRLTVQNIEDLCGNAMDEKGVIINFTTGADVPGVSFVRPSDKYKNACPSTEVFAMFRTSMYNIRKDSCAVDHDFSDGNDGGFVLSGSLSPAGVKLNPMPDDKYESGNNPSEKCKKYSFNLDSETSADDLTPGQEYSAVVNYIKPGDEIKDAKPEQWKFTVAPANQCAKEPYISRISPEDGAWGQCVTIYGGNFGEDIADPGQKILSKLTLEKNPDNELTRLNRNAVVDDTTGIITYWENGDGKDGIDFRKVSTWNNRYITADVADLRTTKKLHKTPPTPPKDLDIDVFVVARIDTDKDGAPDLSLPSNSVKFYIDKEMYTGPCIDKIVPDYGFWGDPVEIRGRRFGAGAGSVTEDSVTFFEDKVQVASYIKGLESGNWNKDRAKTVEKINTIVPDYAKENTGDNGEVFVTVTGIHSNNVEFDISAGIDDSCSITPECTVDSIDKNICRQGLECRLPGETDACTCQIPDQLTIKNPKPSNCQNSCKNAVISFNTSKKINTDSVSNVNVRIIKCSDSKCNSVPPNYILAGIPDDLIISENNTKIEINDKKLDLNTWYRVAILGGDDGLKSLDGKSLSGTNFSVLVGKDYVPAYSWKFRTGDKECDAERISVSPSNALLYSETTAEEFEVIPYGPASSCGGQKLSSNSLSGQFEWGGYIRESSKPEDKCFVPEKIENFLTFTDNEATETKLDVNVNVKKMNVKNKNAWACVQYTNGDNNLLTASSLRLKQKCAGDDDCKKYSDTDPTIICSDSKCINDSKDPNAGKCTPIISDFDPKHGAAGTWVTINGCYFGNSWGEVDIGKMGISTHPYEAPSPAKPPDYAICGDTWKDRKIIAEVGSSTSENGPVNIRARDKREVSRDSFDENDVIRPGICQVVPSEARAGKDIAIKGKNFGSYENFSSDFDNYKVLFTDSADNENTVNSVETNSYCKEYGWSNERVCIKVVDGASEGNAKIKVVASSVESNEIDFTVLKTPEPSNDPAKALKVISYTPGQGNTACLSMIVDVQLQGKLDKSTVEGNFLVRKKDDSVEVEGEKEAEVFYSKSRLRFIPKVNAEGIAYEVGKKYEIVLKAGDKGLLSQEFGKLIAGADGEPCFGMAGDECIIPFDTVETMELHRSECRTESLLIEPNAPVFTCAGKDECDGDDVDTLGTNNQEEFLSTPVSKKDQFVVDPSLSEYEWKTSNDTILSFYEQKGSQESQMFNVLPENGSTIISSQVKGTNISGSTEARVFLCQKPWPGVVEDPVTKEVWWSAFNDTNLDKSFTGEEIFTNFSMFYCMDKQTGLLPELDLRVEVGRGETRDVDNLLKELFFIQPDSKDAIGIRVLQNSKNLSVQEWYVDQKFTGSPTQLSIHDFDALQDGRTIYVNAINDTKKTGEASIYNNIYLISMSDNASEDTINIYEQLVNNWRFLVNIEDINQQEKLRRDLERVEHAYSVAQAINNRSYPIKLESGSFKKGLSKSTWPSWQGALSTDLGITMPKDPIENNINCLGSVEDTVTCWDGSMFVCNGDFDPVSDIKTTYYSYEYKETEVKGEIIKKAIFGFNLEYSTSDNWMNVLQGNGWDDFPGSTCSNMLYVKQF